MAFRRPLYLDGSNLREMTDTHINNMRDRAADEFRNNPSVYLRFVSSGGDLGEYTDTRLRAGAATRTPFRFPTENELRTQQHLPGEQIPSGQVLVVITKSHVDQVVQSVSVGDSSNREYPLYYDSSGNLRAMTKQDMRDTFGYQAIFQLDGAGDLYTIHTSTSLSGYSPVSFTPIFEDTVADLSYYSLNGIASVHYGPTGLDSGGTVRSRYYLMRRNAEGYGYHPNPVRTESGGDIREMSNSQTGTILSNIVRDLAVNVSGYRIRFSYSSGTITGTIVNTVLNGSQYKTKQFNADDYRAQIWPGGNVVTQGIGHLRVQRI
jgi:hypothetical protein